MSDALLAELEASVREGGAILRGGRKATRRHEVAAPARRGARGRGGVVREDARGVPDVVQLRARLQLSQAKFAALLGISLATLRNWEQGRRTPEGPARVLLRVAARHPDAVLDAVAGGGQAGNGARGQRSRSGSVRGPSRRRNPAPTR
jgi:putative transcriptional regulator